MKSKTIIAILLLCGVMGAQYHPIGVMYGKPPSCAPVTPKPQAVTLCFSQPDPGLGTLKKCAPRLKQTLRQLDVPAIEVPADSEVYYQQTCSKDSICYGEMIACTNGGIPAEAWDDRMHCIGGHRPGCQDATNILEHDQQ